MKKSYGGLSAAASRQQAELGATTPIAVNTATTATGNSSVPLAPYPPTAQYAGRHQTRSAATVPYSGGTGGGMPSSATATAGLVSSETKPSRRNKSATSATHPTTAPVRRTTCARFCHYDMVATINSADAATSNNNDTSVLLELKKLRFSSTASSEHEQRPHGQYTSQQPLFELDTVAQNVASQTAPPSVASTCLDVAASHSPSCLGTSFSPIVTGLSTGAVCIHTAAETSMGEQQVQQQPQQQQNPIVLRSNYIPTEQYNSVRPVTAVAWQPQTSAVAVGWGGREANTLGPSLSTGDMPISGSSSERGTSTVTSSSLRPSNSGPSMRGAAGSGGGAVHPSATDLEHGCFLWNVDTGTPLAELAHQVDVASLAWVGSTTLVVGGQLRNAYLYDLRVPSNATTHSAMSTIYAHNFSVSGIETDPHRPHQFATYCTVSNEPVKIWDARRTDNYVAEIKMSQHAEATAHAPRVNYNRSDGGSAATACVASLQWSHRQAGILSLAIEDTIHDYDTTASRPLHVGAFACNDPIEDFCLYPYKVYKDKEQAQEDWLSSLYSRRAVVAYENRVVLDLPKHYVAPLAVSRRDGRVVHGLGKVLTIGSTTTGPAAMESLKITNDEDISSRMMRRARCLHVSKYTMDAASNIKMLAEEECALGQGGVSSPDGLLRLWIWIERVESFCADIDESPDISWVWPVKGLLDAGTVRILYVDERQLTKDTKEDCAPLSCVIYDSPGRRAALAACGWSGRYDLSNIMGECEELEEFERSAALAVWHGDIGAAVSALQRGASSIRSHTAKTGYAETLDQVALCIAGYRGGPIESDPSSLLWHQVCANLLARSELSGANHSSSRIAYLRALLKFLTSSSPEIGNQQVLANAELPLIDRVGFACRFLSREQLKEYLKKLVSECQAKGNIEGLIITGIDKQGIRILQSYVDHKADVQTAALVTSRVIIPSAWALEKRTTNEWLHSYRDFLNTLQMWQSRAMFDVDRASLLREFKARQEAAMAAGSMGGKLKKPKPPGRMLSHDPDVQAPIPAQIDARCNYCGSPLIHRNKDGASIESSLAKMKSVLNCCPTCRKPLPRCAVCLLSLGTINPFQGLLSRMSQEDTSSTTNLPFAEWFAWCARCKHGGHAHHLVGWFANHDACPVSGCDCRCQFDGIKKLNRPALSGQMKTNECTPVPGT